jgi:hypothetical protein
VLNLGELNTTQIERWQRSIEVIEQEGQSLNPLSPCPSAPGCELNLRPIFHRIQRRVEAHILIAFLGYCLWVCLKQKLLAAAGSLTPAQVVHSLKQVILVEVWFDLRKGAKFVCHASPIQKLTNSLSCTIWAGHYPSNRHPKSTETGTSLCGRPEALLKTSMPQNQQVTSFY